MGVARRGVQLLVAEQNLDHADIDLLLEKMGREAVPERVRRDPLVDVGRLWNVSGKMQTNKNGDSGLRNIKVRYKPCSLEGEVGNKGLLFIPSILKNQQLKG